MEWWQWAISPGVLVAVMAIGYRSLNSSIKRVDGRLDKVDERLRAVEVDLAYLRGREDRPHGEAHA